MWFFPSSVINRKKINLLKDSNAEIKELSNLVGAYFELKITYKPTNAHRYIHIFIYYVNIHLHVALFGNPALHPVMRHESFRARLLRGLLCDGFW